MSEGFYSLTGLKASGNHSCIRTVVTALSTYWTMQEEGRQTLLTGNTELHQPYAALVSWSLRAEKKSFVLSSYV